MPAIAALALGTLPAQAQVSDLPPGEFDATDYGKFSGSRGPDWRNIFVGTGQGITNRPSLFGGLRESRRLGLFDNAAYRGLYIPLAPTWRAAIDTSLYPVQGVLTQYTFGAQLKKLLPGDWVAGVGFRVNEYPRAASQTSTFSLERHWGDFGAAYTLFSAKPDTGAAALAHRAQVNYRYGTSGSVGLSFTTGRELATDTPTFAPYSTDVRNWSLSGRHWFARDWAFTYEALSQRQGGLERHEGLRLGLRYRF